MSNYATQMVEDFQSFLEEKAGKCMEHFDCLFFLFTPSPKNNQDPNILIIKFFFINFNFLRGHILKKIYNCFRSSNSGMVYGGQTWSPGHHPGLVPVLLQCGWTPHDEKPKTVPAQGNYACVQRFPSGLQRLHRMGGVYIGLGHVLSEFISPETKLQRRALSLSPRALLKYAFVGK